MDYLQLDQSCSRGHGRRVQSNIHTAAIIGPDTPLRQKLVEELSSANHLIKPIVFASNEENLGSVSFDIVVLLAEALGSRVDKWPSLNEPFLGETRIVWSDKPHLVIVTSALVYGARPANPIPITEKSSVAPNADLPFANRLVAIEQRGHHWRSDQISKSSNPSDVCLSILRPALVLGDKGRWPDFVLMKGLGIPPGDGDPPMQFIHVDDLVSAIAFVCERRLDGIFNVASDGWLDGSQVRALAGTPQHLLIPSLITRFRQRRAENSMGGLLPYCTHPWVVANDALKATGWDPNFTNAQAFVSINRGTLWSRLSPKRRQEFALVTFAGALVGAGVAIAGAARRWLKS